MLKAYSTVKAVMFGVGLIVAAIICGYQFLYAIPKERCDKAGGWWASKWRACTAPGMDITKLTGRPIPRPVEPGDPAPPVQAKPAQPAAK